MPLWKSSVNGAETLSFVYCVYSLQTFSDAAKWLGLSMVKDVLETRRAWHCHVVYNIHHYHTNEDKW